MNKIGNIQNKNILFLQGPIGSFFKKLDLIFRQQGANTFKITLNAADWFFSNKDNTYAFKGKTDEWSPFLESFLKEKNINKIFLFGDCRFYQSQAIQLALKLNIDTFVFEEGYLRPNFITMERYGVNNFSRISRDPQFYMQLNEYDLEIPMIQSTPPKYFLMAYSAIIYYIVSHLCRMCYPNYIHHREPSAVKEFFWWWRNVFRKIKYKFTEKGLLEKLRGELSKKYYFVPLQTYNDFQLRSHSSFNSIEEFISMLMHSYSKNGPKDTFLVIKHHPVDRGRKNYTAFISVLSKELGISDRIIVIHDLHLPSCLKNAIGTITINSTVGLSSLFHDTPVITLGNAIYDIKGLTSKGMSLDDFWRNYKIPDNVLFHRFRNYLINTTQLNGSFYGEFPLTLKDRETYL